MKLIKVYFLLYIRNVKVVFKEFKYPFKTLVKIFFAKLRFIKNNYLIETKNGVKFAIEPNSNDIGMILEYFRDKPYNSIDEFFVSDGDVVVDLGANIGAFSINVAMLNPNGQVFSFEPMPDNFFRFSKNINLNRLKNIKPFQVAISKNNDEIDLLVNKDSAFHSIVNSNNSSSIKKIKVRGITLSSFIENEKLNQINFLKVDIEGAEYDLIYNLEEFVFKIIHKIVFEVHPIDEKRNIKELSTLNPQADCKKSRKSG